MGRDEFLERPAPRVPSTPPERGVWRGQVAVAGNVRKVDVADFGLRVPAIHRVDRFREFSAARLVDTAGVNPNPLVSVAFREHAAPPDLLAYEVTGIEMSTRATSTHQLRQ